MQSPTRENRLRRFLWRVTLRLASVIIEIALPTGSWPCLLGFLLARPNA